MSIAPCAFNDPYFGGGSVAAEPAAKKPKVEDEASLAGGMADIVKAKVTEVGTVSPVEDFKAILAQKDRDMFEDGGSASIQQASQQTFISLFQYSCF